MSQQSNRKNEHVHLSEKFYPEKKSSLAGIRFVHHSLPQISVEDVSLKTELNDFTLNTPFFINAMTGGNEWTGQINKKLAIIARETDLAMAVGSMSVALKQPEVAKSFEIVRETHPDGFLIANLGAGHGLENARKAVDIIDADAFQIHINSIQEIVMPEGDRDFSSWLENISEIVSGLNIPVIVKEVGFGMSHETIKMLEQIGVSYIDISGTGGTNFAQIENFRRENYKLDDLELFGQSTAESLLEAQKSKKKTQIIASGGIRTPQDILKSLALGANAVGISSQMMHLALEDTDRAIQTIDDWKNELIKTMTILGAKTPQNMKQVDILLPENLVHYAQLRGLEYTHYAHKGIHGPKLPVIKL